MLSKHLRPLSANPFSPRASSGQIIRYSGSSGHRSWDKWENKVETDVGPPLGRQNVMFDGIHSACLLLSPSKPQGFTSSHTLSPSPSPLHPSSSLSLSFLCCSPSSRYECALGGLEGFTDGGKNWHSDSFSASPPPAQPMITTLCWTMLCISLCRHLNTACPL